MWKHSFHWTLSYITRKITQYSIAHHYVSSYLQWSRSLQFTAFDSQEFDYDHLQSSILAATELKQLPTVWEKVPKKFKKYISRYPRHVASNVPGQLYHPELPSQVLWGSRQLVPASTGRGLRAWLALREPAFDDCGYKIERIDGKHPKSKNLDMADDGNWSWMINFKSIDWLFELFLSCVLAEVPSIQSSRRPGEFGKWLYCALVFSFKRTQWYFEVVWLLSPWTVDWFGKARTSLTTWLLGLSSTQS